MECYDINGEKVTLENSGSKSLVNYEYRSDAQTGAFYTIVNIRQEDGDGNKQYPFVYWPNYPNGGIESTLQMNRRKKFLTAINAGRFTEPFGPGVSLTGLPVGTVIQNGVVLQQGTGGSSEINRVLTINNKGRLGYALLSDSATDLVANGIVSAVSGFIPILTDYQYIEEADTTITYISNTSDAQRQVIGQYYNGDYIILSCEGRNNQGSGFFTVRQLQDLCKSFGVRDAFLLDGGGSMETVVGDRQLNPIYENASGRVVPTYIVFNGTTIFPE